MSTGGKGSAPRPIGVSKEEFASNWDRIFGKKKEVILDTNGQLNPFPKYNTTSARHQMFKPNMKDNKLTTYCLGTGMSICNSCQHDENWKYLNNDNIILDTERLTLQKDMTRIDEAFCQLSSGKMFLAKELPKQSGCGNDCTGCQCG